MSNFFFLPLVIGKNRVIHEFTSLKRIPGSPQHSLKANSTDFFQKYGKLPNIKILHKKNYKNVKFVFNVHKIALFNTHNKI